jgi:hypothetical protein
MDRPATRKRRAPKPGARALEACGDGFWELDLQDGSAWYSPWFYQKLSWADETRRTTLGDLECFLQPAAWATLMVRIREHLERARPLELDLDVTLPGAGPRRWHLRGSAHRNAAGHPIHLAGSMRELSDEPANAADPAGLQSAFDALPVAAALLDAHAMLVHANRQWRSFPADTTAQAVARLRAANSQTAIEFWLDQGEGFEAGPRRLRVRAVAFQHDGARHLAVTLEDRRSD